MYVLSTEPCTSKVSKVVHTYSPRQQVDGQRNTDDDTAPAPTQLDLDADDTDEDVVDSSDGPPRGRYGRRYDPPDTAVVIVDQPSGITERTQSVTGHDRQISVTSGVVGISRTRHSGPPLSVDVLLLVVLPLLTLLQCTMTALWWTVSCSPLTAQSLPVS